MPSGHGVEHPATGIWLVAEPDIRRVIDRLAEIARRYGIAFRLLDVQHEGDGLPLWRQGQ
jgi:hypothetical protein